MAEQGSYPMNGRVPAGTDTVTSVVTGQTADLPLSTLAAFILNGGGTGTLSGPTSARPTPPLFVGQFYFDTTLGLPIYAFQVLPTIWVDAAGIPV